MPSDVMDPDEAINLYTNPEPAISGWVRENLHAGRPAREVEQELRNRAVKYQNAPAHALLTGIADRVRTGWVPSATDCEL